MTRSLLALALACPLIALAGCAGEHQASEADSGPLVTDGGVVLRDAGPSACPTDINPWDPSDPRSACAPEGASCTSGSGDSCGSFMACDCRGGRWSCLVAEADPVCWCGRQPSEGDRCNEEGASCGECCPTPGGTGWPAMTCEGGHWHSAACPAIECQPLAECPANTRAQIGRPCSAPGASCGDACCDTAIVCEGGVWAPGPVADCFACTSFACGDGLCPSDNLCVSRCGPADGTEYVCVPPTNECYDCSCLVLDASQRCEMIEGHPHVSEVGFCG